MVKRDMTAFCKNNKTIGIYCPQPYLGGELSLSKTIIEALSIKYNINLYLSHEYREYFGDMNEINNVTIYYLDNNQLGYKRFPKKYRERIFNKIYILLSLVGINFKKVSLQEEIVLFNYPSFEILMYPDLPCLMSFFDLRRKYIKMNKIREIIIDYLFNKILQKPLFIIADSRNAKDDLVRFYNVEDDKIKVIPPIPNICNSKLLDLASLRRKYCLPNGFLYYPAHIIPMKNHFNLIKAINHIKTSKGINVNLVLAGPAQNKEYYRDLLAVISKYELDNQVKYLGFLLYEEILTLYKVATALVMPSLFEGAGIPVLEAFYLGCPVVSSNVSALPEQVGDAGLLFDPENIEDMAEKIYRIWIDEDLRKELVEKGYERVEDMTLERYAKQWEDVIKKVMGRAKTQC